MWPHCDAIAQKFCNLHNSKFSYKLTQPLKTLHNSTILFIFFYCIKSSVKCIKVVYIYQMMNDPHFHIAEVCQAENYKKKTKTMVNLLKGI